MPEQWIEAAASEILEHVLGGDCTKFAAIIQRHYDAAVRCSECNGLKTVPIQMMNFPGEEPQEIKCQRCDGTGKVVPT